MYGTRISLGLLVILPVVSGQGLPVVSSFSPTAVPTHAATPVTINGYGFTTADQVLLVPCGQIPLQTTLISPLQIVAVVPAQIAVYGDLQIRRNGLTLSFGQLAFYNPAPVIASVTPPSLSTGMTGLINLTVNGSYLGGLSDPCGFGAPDSLWTWTSPTGNSFSWSFYGNLSASLSVFFPAELAQSPGVGTLRIYNPALGGGGGVASIGVLVACGTLCLDLSQPQGAGSIRIGNACGGADAPYVTAISFATENAISPGTGWWGGLHIALLDLATEIFSQVPPFVGVLNSSGASAFELPAGSLPPGLPVPYAVTRTFGLGLFNILETSAIASIHLL